jgi:hypothetical protein
MIVNYRVWDKELKEFYEPIYDGTNGLIYELTLHDNGELVKRTCQGNHHISGFPKRYVYQLSIGVTDVNNQLIFDGDIVEYSRRINNGKWCDKRGIINYKAPEWFAGNDRFIKIDSIETKYFMVIGHAYNNKGLIGLDKVNKYKKENKQIYKDPWE